MNNLNNLNQVQNNKTASAHFGRIWSALEIRKIAMNKSMCSQHFFVSKKKKPFKLYKLKKKLSRVSNLIRLKVKLNFMSI